MSTRIRIKYFFRPGHLYKWINGKRNSFSFSEIQEKIMKSRAAKWANIFLWRQETRDKPWTGYSCCSFLWNFVCKAFASFFFLLAPLFVLGSPSMGTNRYFLSLGVYKLIKAAFRMRSCKVALLHCVARYCNSNKRTGQFALYLAYRTEQR